MKSGAEKFNNQMKIQEGLSYQKSIIHCLNIILVETMHSKEQKMKVKKISRVSQKCETLSGLTILQNWQARK